MEINQLDSSEKVSTLTVRVRKETRDRFKAVSKHLGFTSVSSWLVFNGLKEYKKVREEIAEEKRRKQLTQS